MKIWKRLIWILLVFSMTLGLSGAAVRCREGELPAFREYHPAGFVRGIEKLERLIEKGRTGAALNQFDALCRERLYMEDLYTVAELRYDENVSDSRWEEKCGKLFHTLMECDDMLMIAGQKMAVGSMKDALEEHLGEDCAAILRDYEPLDDELTALFSREQELESEYYTALDELSEQETEFCNTCGEIFTELVAVRDQIAESCGYDTYSDYADAEIYARDYDAGELEAMKKAAKEFGTEYELALYIAYFLMPEYVRSGEEIVNDLEKCISGISPLADEAFSFFSDHGLYSVGNGSGRLMEGYTTVFYTGHCPYIFYYLYGSADDITGMVHEFGHFTDEYWNDNPCAVLLSGSYDLFEIHSTGLQMLANERYKTAMGEGAELVEAYNTANLCSYVMDGCIYDEWQREVYAHPEMTVGEINNCFREVYLSYGGEDYEGLETEWMWVTHNFDSPMYYISYAASAIAALQIWERSLTDYDGAVKIWENIVKAGAYEDGYMEVVKNAGLKLFTDADAVYKTLSAAGKYAAELTRPYEDEFWEMYDAA